MTGSCGRSIFNFLRDCQIVSHRICTISHFHQQVTRIPVAPHPHQHLVFSMLRVYMSITCILVRSGTSLLTCETFTHPSVCSVPVTMDFENLPDFTSSSLRLPARALNQPAPAMGRGAVDFSRTRLHRTHFYVSSA